MLAPGKGSVTPGWLSSSALDQIHNCQDVDDKRGGKRRGANREEPVKEEQERDADENEDKGQEEWHDYLEFPKKPRDEHRPLVHHFTDSRIMTLNKFLPKQTLNEHKVRQNHTNKIRNNMN